MSLRSIWYFAKPMLVVQDGALKTENVPVPRWSPKWQFFLEPAERFRVAQLFAKLKVKLSKKTAESVTSDSAVEQVVSAIIRDLGAMSRVSHGSLVLVYLPTLADYLHVNPWRERVRRESEASNVLYLDLSLALRRLPPDSAVSMFITEKGDKAQVVGHYSVGGNQWVADTVFEFLVGVPEIADHLRRGR